MTDRRNRPGDGRGKPAPSESGSDGPNRQHRKSAAGGNLERESVAKGSRRELLRALAAVPVFGGLLAGGYAKHRVDAANRERINEALGISGKPPAFVRDAISAPRSQRIRLGVVGFGYEGEQLCRAAGFATPAWTEASARAAEANPRHTRLKEFMSQLDLNVELTAVSDLFSVRAEAAVAASTNPERPGGGPVRAAKIFRDYRDMLSSGLIDAIMIATPDHWHARISIDAAEHGIPLYCEKPLTRTEDEVIPVVDAVKRSGVPFQLGHQGRQADTQHKAREIVEKRLLGPITLAETTTNRNSPWGAWIWKIPPGANRSTVDWVRFQEQAGEKHPFSLERFFRWRLWYDYGTGLVGDLMSHEFDAVNQIMQLGIPDSCSASGGIYHFRDGREVPDVFQAVLEYDDLGFSLLYSATLANNRPRGRVLMGHDAAMEVGPVLRVYIDGGSSRYRGLIDEGTVDPSQPVLTYRPEFRGVDAVTSPTEEYFASRGLMYTYRSGARANPLLLHIDEWLNAIRHGGTTSCNIDRALEEAIACHMATRSYLEGRRVAWDPVQRRIT